MSPLTISLITLPAFLSTLSRYSSSVPEKLRELDKARYETIPAALGERREDAKGGEGVRLEKEEVVGLVEWKLKHGTFRPKLLQLVESNPTETIESATKAAFSLLPKDPSPKAILAALKVLTGLRGIGPATASLLLSVYALDTVPFFSDEVFRWVMWGDPGAGKVSGWKRPIKYNVKEYEILIERVGELSKRLEVGAVEVERAAWVLGREGVNLDEGGGAREGEGVMGEGLIEEKTAKVNPNDVGEKKKDKGGDSDGKGTVRKGVKRKKDDREGKTPSEGVRRSSRRKTEK